MKRLEWFCRGCEANGTVECETPFNPYREGLKVFEVHTEQSPKCSGVFYNIEIRRRGSDLDVSPVPPDDADIEKLLGGTGVVDLLKEIEGSELNGELRVSSLELPIAEQYIRFMRLPEGKRLNALMFLHEAAQRKTTLADMIRILTKLGEGKFTLKDAFDELGKQTQ